MTSEIDARVSLILALLNDGHSQELNLAQLSTNCNLSYSRVRHLFKQQTGTTPGRYLKKVKLARAQDLLKRSFYTVKQIAFLTGFSDISHFVRDYKLQFGDTPTNSRRLNHCPTAAKPAKR